MKVQGLGGEWKVHFVNKGGMVLLMQFKVMKKN